MSLVCHAMRRFSDFLDDIWSEYDMQDALGEGVTTGWQGLDNLYRVRTLAHVPACCSSFALLAVHSIKPGAAVSVYVTVSCFCRLCQASCLS